MLFIKNLHASSGGKELLRGINLRIGRGEAHFLMGPNGAGKSTLARVLMGHPAYKVSRGQIIFAKKDIVNFTPELRAKSGIYLAFQNPVEFEGINAFHFMREMAAALSVSGGVDPVASQGQFLKNAAAIGLDVSFGDRDLNWGFSGGEKKKMEILQLIFFCAAIGKKPKLLILDEIDSGLDVDSLRSVAKAICRLKKSCEASILLITHTARMAKYLKPDYAHIMLGGRIVKSGKKDLVAKIDKYGYQPVHVE